MADKGQAAFAALRRLCTELARAVMDVMHADCGVVFLPSRDMSKLEFALGLPRNTMGSKYSEGLIGIPLMALPVAKFLLEGHSAALHRDDDIALLPGQPEVMPLLGVETIGMVASTPFTTGTDRTWSVAASFTYPDRVDPDSSSVGTVRKLLDADAPDLFSLLQRVS